MTAGRILDLIRGCNKETEAQSIKCQELHFSGC